MTITVTMRTSVQDVKWEAWHDLNFERRLLGKRQIFSEGGCSFFIKNKLKSEIFDDKKLYKIKIFVSVKTKSLNIIYNIKGGIA